MTTFPTFRKKSGAFGEVRAKNCGACVLSRWAAGLFGLNVRSNAGNLENLSSKDFEGLKGKALRQGKAPGTRQGLGLGIGFCDAFKKGRKNQKALKSAFLTGYKLTNSKRLMHHFGHKAVLCVQTLLNIGDDFAVFWCLKGFKEALRLKIKCVIGNKYTLNCVFWPVSLVTKSRFKA